VNAATTSAGAVTGPLLQGAGGAGPSLTTRFLALAELDAATVDAWADLERRAVEPNVFLSPHFVLPALRHLEPELRPVILTVSRPGGALVGLGVFRDRPAAKRFPLRHLRAFCSIHSYLSGWLLDREHAREAIGALLGRLSARGTPWHGLVFAHLPADEGHRLMLEAAGSLGGHWFEYARCTRATLEVAEAGERHINEQFSSQRLKALRRKRRQLEDSGPVTWTLQAAPEIEGCIDRFLHLEHSGWKGAAGESLLSSRANEAFFRDMVEGLRREGRVFFTELSVGSEVVSSTSNLVSGNEGFAFKIGWDPRYATMSVGILNEVELIRHAPALLGHLTRLDSGSEPGSYMEEMWRGRRILVDGLLTTTGIGHRAGQLAALAFRLKRRLVSAVARAAPSRARA
jgi:CelD/BcsL family acetyltransferase involved in cellulose biosynthesis